MGLIGGLFFYFIPSYVALKRDHHQKMAIFVLNLFLGRSFLGWVAALIWASTPVVGRKWVYRSQPKAVHRPQPVLVKPSLPGWMHRVAVYHANH